MHATPKLRRRWFRFSLRAMLAMLTLAAAACWFLPRQVAPQIGPYDITAACAVGSGNSIADKWINSSEYIDIQYYADRPDEQTLGALDVDWQAPELDALGNFCTIRGRLKLRGDDPRRTKPVDWFQGIAVYLATRPDAKPDWSQGMSQADSVYDHAVTSPSGRFEVLFDLRGTQRDRTRDESIQVGLALASHKVTEKTRQTVVWRSRTPAIPATVQMLTVPAAPPLSAELELIHRASRWPLDNPDGVDLIRAVNALQALGKDRALAVLQEYDELSRNSHYADPRVVFWIIRVLFQPVCPDDQGSRPLTGTALYDGQWRARNWPLNPLEVSAGIPFMVGQPPGRTTGPGEQVESHIAWARLYGVVRERPLAPTANPLAAAQSILDSPRFAALSESTRDSVSRAIQSQAIAMSNGMVQPIPEHEILDDEGWRSRLQATVDSGIHWDAEREQFAREAMTGLATAAETASAPLVQGKIRP